MTKKKMKVVLAYSGGLDTSIILKWLQTTYRCEVVTFTADLGQGEEVEPARRKAELLGIRPENIFIEDLREEFVRDYVFPMFRANTVYEGQYLLGTSIARPLIAKRQIEIARAVGADAIPVQTRMMTIADIYDALTATDRPYKKAIRVEDALDTLRDEQRAGTIDGHLLDLFIEARVFERTDWR